MQLQWWIIWRYAKIVAVEIAIKAIANYRETEFWCFNEIRPLRPLSRKARNFSGPKANFKIKICWIVAQFGHKPVNFASLTDSFVLTFSNYWTLILNVNAANRKQLSGPEKKLLGLSWNRPLRWRSSAQSTGPWTSTHWEQNNYL